MLYTRCVHRFFTPLLRRLYGLFAVLVVVYAAFFFGQYTRWNKERLYRKLLSGDRGQKLSAGFDLAWLGGQEQLLHALRSPSAPVREIAVDSLWSLWFHAAGKEAFRLAHSKYPNFAEGWNRRAILYWQMGQYEESIADCKKVVALNPGHFGAWQGMGLCQLRVGDLEGACQSLRVALKINPRDAGLRRKLQQCEELLRRLSPERFHPVDWV
ncbi:MAG: hypothetical protein DME19_07390 [Verrucomicrobia bacterium]|nr:MAG: hypothetical protein DME19_07390 [Verrucomicrobiota bacterium]